MEMKKIVLLFEKESNLKIVEKIIDEEPALIYSILRLMGCEKCPDSIAVKLGIINKYKNKPKK